jgi:hypothetical protein
VNRRKALLSAVDALRDGMNANTQAWAGVEDKLKLLQIQMAALTRVVSDMNLVPKPDADGWIARPTLR